MGPAPARRLLRECRGRTSLGAIPCTRSIQQLHAASQKVIMRIKIVYDAAPRRTWAIRLVEQGDWYGLADQLPHTDVDPLVEFYDTRYPHTDLGQFVARYSSSSLLQRQQWPGLCLHGGVPDWTVSDDAMTQVMDWLREHVPQTA